MTVKLLKPEDHSHANVIDVLEKSLKRAKAGELVGIILIAEERATGYEYSRCNISYEKTLGLLNRAQWIMNQDWDKAK